VRAFASHPVTLVTGASRGIGCAVARAFAREGLDIALLARPSADLDCVAHELAVDQIRAYPFSADVADPAQVKSAVARVLEVFGRIDVLVNAAGVYGPIGPLAEADMSAWAAAIATNLMGTAYAMRAVLPHMVARRGGAIVNFSGGGAVAPFPRFSAYSASKAAVVRLTETVAEEVRESGVRVNAIAPGAVNTRLLDEVLAAGERAGADFYKNAIEQKASGGTPPERAAELAVFLASPAAAAITGRLISAVWDDWRSLAAAPSDLRETSLYTLRRIDGRKFTEVAETR
jgi:NAD(P)-dependent dehydrogenase (short-subunit alcohol dehydrogenase family)